MVPSPTVESTPTTVASHGPVVRAVLFWSPGCGHCHEVIEKVLPPLQTQYGSRLDIRMINVSEANNLELLYQVARAAGLSSDRVGVPFLVIGDQVLIGSLQISLQLPPLIEKHLAAGGVGWTSWGGLADELGAESAAPSCAPSTPCADPPEATVSATTAAAPGLSNGFALAIIVMALMAAVLIYAIGMLIYALRRGRMRRGIALGWQAAVLAAIGLGVAAYLAYVETQSVAAVCGPVGDCNAVQASPYARLFGVLPIGVLGVVGYVAILVAWLWSHLPTWPLAGWMPSAVFAMSLAGTAFSLYLTFLEPFVIKAVCAWCLTSAVIMAALLLLSARTLLGGETAKAVR